MIAVIVHVYYPEMWPELAACIRNVGACDVFVTYVDEAAVAAARRDFPNAQFIACENRGYDVWPFLKALKSVDLAKYDVVVKLHTKRNIERKNPFYMGRTRLNGSLWRDKLLSFVRTPESWRQTLARFEDASIGMVAGRQLIFGRTEGGKESFDEAIAELRKRLALHANRRGLFVGGTMFAVRAALLRPFASDQFTPNLFAASGPHEPTTFAHIMERMLGLAVSAQGLRLEAFDGNVRLHRLGCRICRFFFDNRWSERRHSIRICGITLYRKKFADE